MSFFLFKSILGTFFLVSGAFAVTSMLSLMGKTERKASPKILRTIHRTSGFIFLALLLVISYFCLKYWATIGDQASIRAVFHAVLALTVLILLILKILIVRFYNQFLRFAPVMGITIFTLSFVVFSTSAGFFFIRTLCPSSESSEISTSSASMVQGNVEKGSALFAAKCASCHHPQKGKNKPGPSLKNILKRKKLPTSGRPATIENIRHQIIRPILTMPSFSYFTEQEMADLLAYMKTL